MADSTQQTKVFSTRLRTNPLCEIEFEAIGAREALFPCTANVTCEARQPVLVLGGGESLEPIDGGGASATIAGRSIRMATVRTGTQPRTITMDSTTPFRA